MLWGQLPRLGNSARTSLAIAPLLPVIVASLYFTRDLYWSPGYPVRIPWDQIPEIPPVSSQEAASLRADMALAAPILEGEVADDAAMNSAVDAGSAVSSEMATDDGNRTGMETNGNNARSALPGVLPLSFDLIANPDAGGMIQVRKSVSFNQQSLGMLSVRIDEGSRVFVSRVDMGRLFPESQRPPRSWQDEYVLLSQVRTAGIDLRYDPTADQFVLRDDTPN